MKEGAFKIAFISVEPGVKGPAEMAQIIHNKKSRKNKSVWNRNEYEKKEIAWTIRQYIGEENDDGIDWQYQGSAPEISDVLTSDMIAATINGQNAFDFEYLPKENDFLIIYFYYINQQVKNKSRPFTGEFISFIFGNGQWIKNEGYDHIRKEYVDFKQGIIKFEQALNSKIELDK